MARTLAKDPAKLKDWVLNIAIPGIYPLGLLVLWLAPMNFGFGRQGVIIAGWVLGLGGLTLWILGMVSLGKHLAVLPGAKRLVTRGVYRVLRHPIYLGITLTLLGLVLCLGSAWGLAYLLALVVPLNVVRAVLEERVLRAQFGVEYQAWHERTWF